MTLRFSSTRFLFLTFGFLVKLITLIIFLLPNTLYAVQWCSKELICADRPEDVCNSPVYKGQVNTFESLCNKQYIGIIESDKYGPSGAGCMITHDGHTGDGSSCGSKAFTNLNGIGRVDVCSPGQIMNAQGECLPDCSAPFSLTAGQCSTTCPASSPNLQLGSASAACSGGPQQQCTNAGNPVNFFTGEKIQNELPDFQDQGVYPLMFTRNYRSRRAPESDPKTYKNSLDYQSGALSTVTRSDDVIYYQPSDYTGVIGALPHSGGLNREIVETGYLPHQREDWELQHATEDSHRN